MGITRAHEFFDLLAIHTRDRHFPDVSGTLQFDVEGAGTWSLVVDGGVMTVAHGPSATPPTTCVQLSEQELVRLAGNEKHENLITALLRGTLRIQGDIGFGHEMQAFLPIPADWEKGA